MNTNALDSLAEAVWRRAVGYIGTDECCHGKHERNIEFLLPDDCGLFREIHDEIVLWASAQTP